MNNNLENGDIVIVRQMPKSCETCECFNECKHNVVGNSSLPVKIEYIDEHTADITIMSKGAYEGCDLYSIKIDLNDLKLHPDNRRPNHLYKCYFFNNHTGESDEEISKIVEFNKILKNEPSYYVESCELFETNNGTIYVEYYGYFVDNDIQLKYDELSSLGELMLREGIVDDSGKYINKEDEKPIMFKKKKRKNFLK